MKKQKKQKTTQKNKKHRIAGLSPSNARATPEGLSISHFISPTLHLKPHTSHPSLHTSHHAFHASRFTTPNFTPQAPDFTPHTSQLTSHTSHLTPHTSYSLVTPQTSYLTRETGNFVSLQGGMVMMLPNSGMLQSSLFVWATAKHELTNLARVIEHRCTMSSLHCRATPTCP